MDKRFVSFNGDTALANTSNYVVRFPMGIPHLPMPQVVSIQRPYQFPAYGGKVLDSMTMVLQIEVKGSDATRRNRIEALKALFDTGDDSLKSLVIADADDSNRQWYMMCTAISLADDGINLATAMLYAPEPFWRTVATTPVNTSTSLTSFNLIGTTRGNKRAKPSIALTPTSGSGSGYSYRRWIGVYSNIESTLTEYPLLLSPTSWNTSALLNDTSRSLRVNNGAGITAVQTTIPVDTPVGTFPTSGVAMIESEQIAYTGYSGGNLTGVTRGYAGTTAATHADNTLIYASRVLANADDVRVMVNGTEIPRWVSGLGTADTRVWANVTLRPKRSMRLGSSIAGSGAVTTITLRNTNENKRMLKKMSSSGLVLIDSEVFAYTGINLEKRQITGVTRASRYTSMAAHSYNAVVSWVEHDIWLVYGNPNAGPVDQDDSKMPSFSLSGSTNTSWAFTEFVDSAELRSGSWHPVLVKSANTIDPDHMSGVYTGTNATEADPAEVVGMSVRSFLNGSTWKADNATIRWTLAVPCVCTTLSASGSKRRVGNTWPTVATMQKSKDGKKWENVWATETKPSTSGSWVATATRSGVSLGSGSWKYLSAVLSGGVSAGNGQRADLEYTSITAVMDSAQVPTVSVGTEQTPYHLNATIAHAVTGHTLYLDVPMALNETVTIDTEAKTVKFGDGTNVAPYLSFDELRFDWLDLLPSVGNQINFTVPGNAGISVTVSWKDRAL